MAAPLPPLAPLRAWLGRAGRLHLHLDFDGTLVPIAPDPDGCRLDPPLRDLLERLVQHPRLAVAILSGRSLADLEQRLQVPGLALAGNHGLEITCGRWRWRHPQALQLVPLLQELAARAEAQLAGIPGAWVENKTLSLSLHSRQVPSLWRPRLQQRLERLRTELAACPAVSLRQGKEVLELRPALAWTKASACRYLSDGRPSQQGEGLFYAGDDDSDEDVFRAFPEAISIKIGPDASTSAARFHLSDPWALRRLLAQLLQDLQVP